MSLKWRHQSTCLVAMQQVCPSEQFFRASDLLAPLAATRSIQSPRSATRSGPSQCRRNRSGRSEYPSRRRWRQCRRFAANERHRRGVDASIADHVAKGFEIVDRGPRAVDVPGFPTPRLYDYIIRDPVTGRCYGVEVKTTIMSTIRLDRQQVEKDAVVVAQGAKVRLLNNVELSGVSYSVYCFGCEAFDVRSAVLLNILQKAGVPVVPGILPGDIRP